MGKSLYRGFDNRARSFFGRLMRGIREKEHPEKDFLVQSFISEVAKNLPTTPADTALLTRACNFSYDAHLETKIRDSGEAYIFHPFRSALVEVWIQMQCGVCDISVIVDVLLHDCFEEAIGELYNRLLVRSRVRQEFGAETSYDVHTLTKHKERSENNDAYLRRLVTCDRWRPLAAKFDDRIDNIWTIEAVSRERMLRKIRETEVWFPQIADRLHHLIQNEIGSGRLKNPRHWPGYVKFHVEYLEYALAEKRGESHF